MWGKVELAHKPALIVFVSSDDGGSYPVAESRMSSYKNSRICYLPEHLIIRNVSTVFNTSADDHSDIAQCLAYCLTMPKEYGLAFRKIRGSEAANQIQ